MVANESGWRLFALTFAQIVTVDSFTSARGLQLCEEKCAKLSSCNPPSSTNHHRIGNSYLEMENMWACGRISHPQERSLSLMELTKLMLLFSLVVILVTLLNPFSSRSLVDSWIIPIHMHGSESWVLNVTLLKRLESFQAKIGNATCSFLFSASSHCLCFLRWPST